MRKYTLYRYRQPFKLRRGHEGLVPDPDPYEYSVKTGLYKYRSPGRQVTRAAEFCTVAANTKRVFGTEFASCAPHGV